MKFIFSYFLHSIPLLRTEDSLIYLLLFIFRGVRKGWPDYVTFFPGVGIPLSCSSIIESVVVDLTGTEIGSEEELRNSG